LLVFHKTNPLLKYDFIFRLANRLLKLENKQFAKTDFYIGGVGEPVA